MSIPLKIFFPDFGTTKTLMFDPLISVDEAIKEVYSRTPFIDESEGKIYELYAPRAPQREKGRYLLRDEILGSCKLAKKETIQFRVARRDHNGEIIDENEDMDDGSSSFHFVSGLSDMEVTIPLLTSGSSESSVKKPIEHAFIIEVVYNDKKWSLSRDITEFAELADDLFSQFPKESFKLPPKATKKTMKKWLQTIMEKPKLVENKKLRDFLEIQVSGTDTSSADQESHRVRFEESSIVMPHSEIGEGMMKISEKTGLPDFGDVILLVPVEEIEEDTQEINYFFQLSSQILEGIAWTVVHTHRDVQILFNNVNAVFGSKYELMQLQPEGKGIAESAALLKMMRTHLQKCLQRILSYPEIRTYQPVYDFFGFESLEYVEGDARVNEVLESFSIIVSPGKRNEDTGDLLFKMFVSDGATSWAIEQPYSEFGKLDRVISSLFETEKEVELPEVLDYDSQSLVVLGKELQAYITSLLRLPGTDQVAPFLQFLHIPYEEDNEEDFEDQASDERINEMVDESANKGQDEMEKEIMRLAEIEREKREKEFENHRQEQAEMEMEMQNARDQYDLLSGPPEGEAPEDEHLSEIAPPESSLSEEETGGEPGEEKGESEEREGKEEKPSPVEQFEPTPSDGDKPEEESEQDKPLEERIPENDEDSKHQGDDGEKLEESEKEEMKEVTEEVEPKPKESVENRETEEKGDNEVEHEGVEEAAKEMESKEEPEEKHEEEGAPEHEAVEVPLQDKKPEEPSKEERQEGPSESQVLDGGPQMAGDVGKSPEPQIPVAKKPPVIPLSKKPPVIPVSKKPPVIPMSKKPPERPVAKRPPAVPMTQIGRVMMASPSFASIDQVPRSGLMVEILSQNIIATDKDGKPIKVNLPPFSIKSRIADNEFIVEKDYNDFLGFDEQVRRLYQGRDVKIPPFPTCAKTEGLNPAVVRIHRRNMGLYLQGFLSNQELRMSPILLKFLNVIQQERSPGSRIGLEIDMEKMEAEKRAKTPVPVPPKAAPEPSGLQPETVAPQVHTEHEASKEEKTSMEKEEEDTRAPKEDPEREKSPVIVEEGDTKHVGHVEGPAEAIQDVQVAEVQKEEPPREVPQRIPQESREQRVASPPVQETREISAPELRETEPETSNMKLLEGKVFEVPRVESSLELLEENVSRSEFIALTDFAVRQLFSFLLDTFAGINNKNLCFVFLIPDAEVMAEGLRTVAYNPVVCRVSFEKGMLSVFSMPHDVENFAFVVCKPSFTSIPQISKIQHLLTSRGVDENDVSFVTFHCAPSVLRYVAEGDSEVKLFYAKETKHIQVSIHDRYFGVTASFN